MADLYILVGVPACGKSTFCKTMIPEDAWWVSRDAIRYSLLTEYDKYFAKETLVKRTFLDTINAGLAAGHDVYADATHLDHGSRMSTISRVKGYDNLYAIFLNTPFDLCLARNAARTGRERVPDEDMYRMNNKLEIPALYEGFKKIFIVSNDGEDIEEVGEDE